MFTNIFLNAQNQEDINTQISKIYRKALIEGKSYDWLDHLTNQIGGRLSGSLNMESAVKWAKEEIENGNKVFYNSSW